MLSELFVRIWQGMMKKSVHKPCENRFLKLSCRNVCEFRKFLLLLQMTQLARKGERVLHIGNRTFTNVIFRVSNLANLNPSLKKRNRNVYVGCLIPSPPYLYRVDERIYSRRGLTRVAYL